MSRLRGQVAAPLSDGASHLMWISPKRLTWTPAGSLCTALPASFPTAIPSSTAPPTSGYFRPRPTPALLGLLLPGFVVRGYRMRVSLSGAVASWITRLMSA